MDQMSRSFGLADKCINLVALMTNSELINGRNFGSFVSSCAQVEKVAKHERHAKKIAILVLSKKICLN